MFPPLAAQDRKNHKLSEKGIKAGIQLVICHRGLAENSTEPWVQLLEEALLAA